MKDGVRSEIADTFRRFIKNKWNLKLFDVYD